MIVESGCTKAVMDTLIAHDTHTHTADRVMNILTPWVTEKQQTLRKKVWRHFHTKYLLGMTVNNNTPHSDEGVWTKRPLHKVES